MSDDVLVKVDNVSKRFCRSLKRSLWYGLQDLGSEIGGRRHGGGSGLPQSSTDVQLRPDEFWAVKDVSFELRRGECLGLIGRNGAGKTTLLRMLNGLIKPDTGYIQMRGQIGALIALGAGFNPILTGRENIYTSASVLGISNSQINRKIDEIIEFAEISDFIDSPVQAYSSGMQVRLGFAVASSLDSDILLLDEVLAVGDLRFRAKCRNRIKEKQKDLAVIFVSHDDAQVREWCNKGLYLKSGEIMACGRSEDALNRYLSDQEDKSHILVVDNRILERESQWPSATYHSGQHRLIFSLDELKSKIHFYSMTLHNSSGTPIASSLLDFRDNPEVIIDVTSLNSGFYTVTVNIHEGYMKSHLDARILVSHRAIASFSHESRNSVCSCNISLPVIGRPLTSAINSLSSQS